MTKYSRILAFACGVALFASPLANLAYAQETEVEEITLTGAPVTTDTVQVTATRSIRDIMDIGYSVDVITEEEIERSTATTLSDLLRNVPGVTVTSGASPASDRITIRNEGAGDVLNGTLVFIDGVKVSAVFHGHGADLVIDPANIERIEVIKGPATVLYGSEALGGVVNIITKKGGSEPIQGSFRTAYSGESDSFINSLSLFGALNDFEYRLTGGYTHAHDNLDYHSYGENTLDRLDLSAFVGYNFTDNLEAGVTYELVSDRYEGINTTSSQDSDTDTQTNRIAGYLEVRSLTDYLTRVRVDGYYYNNNQEIDHYRSATTGLYDRHRDTTVQSAGLTLQSDWLIGDHTFIIAGYDFLYEKYDRSEYRHSTGITEDRNASQTTNAAYVSVEHFLPHNFTLNYGARYVFFDTGVENGIDSTGAVSFTPASESTNRPVFNVNLVWSGIENLALRAAWSQGFRPASFYYKFLNTSGHGGFRGNPDLESESSNNFELGARYDNGALAADLAVYYNHSRNRIESLSMGTYTTWINFYETETWGAELSLSYLFDSGIEPYVTGAWTTREARDENGDASNLLYPELTANFGVRYTHSLLDGYLILNADLFGRYQSSMDGYTSIIWGRPYITDPTPAFTTVNFSIGATWGEEKDYFAELYFNNIFDEKYQLYSTNSYYQAGFNMGFSAGFRF